jgi:hypothetical protein
LELTVLTPHLYTKVMSDKLLDKRDELGQGTANGSV